MMSDKLPSLFDFEEDALFSKQEKTGEVAPQKKADPQPEKKKETESKTTKEPNQDITASNGQTSPSKSRPISLENPESNKAQLSEKKSSTNLFKPSLELPLSRDTEIQQNNNEESPESNSFMDIQIGNHPEPSQPVIAFNKEEEEPEALPEKIKESDATFKNEEATTDLLERDDPESTKLPEWHLDKQYYTIGEVAKLFNVNVSHIRFWTTEFKMKTRTTRKGDRLYTTNQITDLRLIHHLIKEKGHTLKGAKQVLKDGSAHLEGKLDIKEELQKLHQMLSNLKESL